MNSLMLMDELIFFERFQVPGGCVRQVETAEASVGCCCIQPISKSVSLRFGFRNRLPVGFPERERVVHRTMAFAAGEQVHFTALLPFRSSRK